VRGNGSESTRRFDQETIVDGLVSIVLQRDAGTGHHLNAVGLLSRQLATQLGFDAATVERVTLAGRLHDVGKQMVELELLRKPGALTIEEWATMRRHPEYGAMMVGSFQPLQGFVDIIHSHHERIDGTGYPRGLVGDEICYEARIVAVADAFHAMTVMRPYTEMRAPQEALAEIERCAGTQFDADVVAVFIEMMGGVRRWDGRLRASSDRAEDHAS